MNTLSCIHKEYKKEGENMQLTENQVTAIKRKRGELDMSITVLANTTKVSKRTLIDIFKHNHRNVTKNTFKKLNDWLIDEYERKQ
ncbi:hypothetical protein HMPREF3210_00580 [Lactobacillus gasseri]|nr:hypothetical protein HMPREF3210_00580 [Lactobacillus gasseri]